MVLTGSLCLLSLLSCAAFGNAADAKRFNPMFRMPRPAVPTVSVPSSPVTSRNGTTLPPYDTVFNFSQLIDHTDPSKGTFIQRYFFTWEWYESGGPITLFTPGESTFDGFQGYLTNETVVGRTAQALSGASVVIEHRFFGLSNPGPDLSAASLQLLTLDQAMDDLVYFAQNVKLPMPGGDQVTPDKAAWILMGGSYSGALTAWTMVARPGIFWSGYASSAVVETINFFWGYFEPIRQKAPQNCTADVEKVIAHLDQTFSNGSPAEILALKTTFGMQNVTHLDDVASALQFNLFDWQSLSPTAGHGQFFQFCDALEFDNGVTAPATGFGLDHALTAWGNYFKNIYLPNDVCGDEDVADCLTSYDLTQSFWSDVSLGQDFRSWMWFVCNQFGYLQVGAPSNWPTIVSRLVTPIYTERECEQLWPDFFKSPPIPNTVATNKETTGWDVNIDRLFFANGNRDPWREATVSSDYHFRQSTENQPIFVSDGFHCSDLLTEWTVDPTVADVAALGVAYLGRWQEEWRQAHPHVSSASAFSTPNPDTLTKPPPFTPFPIPPSVINAPPAPLPASVTGNSTAKPATSQRPSKHHAFANAWDRKFE